MTIDSHPETATVSALSVPARPGPFPLDVQCCAIVVVDMQNDFGSSGGAFDRVGIDISMIRRAVAQTARVLAVARRSGVPIFYLKMAFKPDLSDAGPADSKNRMLHQRLSVGTQTRAPNGDQSAIFIRDSWNTDIVSELAPEPEDTVVYKHRFSGFFETELDALLRHKGIRQLIVTGCTTSICVESTIRDAMFRDYACVLLEDCSAEPIGNAFPRTNHDASLLTIETSLGWVSSSDSLLNAFASRDRRSQQASGRP